MKIEHEKLIREAITHARWLDRRAKRRVGHEKPKKEETTSSCQRCGETFSGDDIEECLFSLHQLTLCEYCVGEMSQN